MMTDMLLELSWLTCSFELHNIFSHPETFLINHRIKGPNLLVFHLSLQSMCLQVGMDKCCMAQTPAKLVSASQFFRDGKYPRTTASTKKLETTSSRYLCLSTLKPTPECSVHSGIKSCHSHYPDPKDVLTSLSQHATQVCDCRKQSNWDLYHGNMC